MRVLWQIGLIFGICLVGEGVSLLLPISFPSSVIGMILLFTLLMSKYIKTNHIKETSDFLIKNMAFLFIPSGVGVIQVFDSIKDRFVSLVLVCIISTIVTFAVTSFTVRGIIRLQNWLSSKGGRVYE